MAQTVNESMCLWTGSVAGERRRIGVRGLTALFSSLGLSCEVHEKRSALQRMAARAALMDHASAVAWTVERPASKRLLFAPAHQGAYTRTHTRTRAHAHARSRARQAFGTPGVFIIGSARVYIGGAKRVQAGRRLVAVGDYSHGVRQVGRSPPLPRSNRITYGRAHEFVAHEFVRMLSVILCHARACVLHSLACRTTRSP